MTLKTVIKYILVWVLLSMAIFTLFISQIWELVPQFKNNFLSMLPVEVKWLFVMFIWLVTFMVWESFS